MSIIDQLEYDSDELLESVKQWERTYEDDLCILQQGYSDRFEDEFKSRMTDLLQQFADAEQLHVIIRCGVGASYAVLYDYPKNLVYRLDVMDDHTYYLDWSLNDPEKLKKYDPDEMSDIEYDKWYIEKKESFYPLRIVSEIMNTTYTSDIMTTINFDITPKFQLVAEE